MPTTLARLKAQEPATVPWEVLLIDNASTDGTTELARSCWKDGPAPLRIVVEPMLGTRFARERGLLEAAYSIIGFVDDDNWVAHDWVRTAYEVMSSDQKLGAVSSIRIAASDAPLPAWFDSYRALYAIFTDHDLETTTQPPLYLPTGGLCVRRKAWSDLVKSGFRALVPGRVGEDLSGGEDTELTTALRLRGWNLAVDPRLRIQPFIAGDRLAWNYLRRFMRRCNASTVLLDAYSDHSLSLSSGWRRRVSDWWWYQAAKALVRLTRMPWVVFLALASTGENRADMIEVERQFGRAVGLLRVRGHYGAARRAVRGASWLSERPEQASSQALPASASLAGRGADHRATPSRPTIDGISVVICCHNSSSRLPTTLAHLKEQEPAPVPWEVLLIDNASTDDTAEVARSCWKDGPVPLRIVVEPTLGTRYARERGLLEAMYSIVGFVDDDNWVARDWVRGSYEVMCSDLRLGAVSSVRIAASDAPLPRWFDSYHSPYAILTEQDLERMQQPPPYLPTAGLCVRRKAWQELVSSGYLSLVPGRVGADLSGGEDTELTVALRRMGWKLGFDRRMRLQHYIPQRRAQWTYLRKLMRSCDASTVLLDAYTDHSLSLKPGLRQRVSDLWCYQMGKALTELVCMPGAALVALSSTGENCFKVIEVERKFGRVLGLLRVRGRYGASRRMVREVSWKQLCHPRELDCS